MIGSARESEEFRTSSHRLAAFAAAVGARDSDHLAGQVAVPTFAHVPAMQSMVEVMQGATAGFVFHGEHDYVFHAPIRPGMRLFTRSELVGKKGNSAGLLLVVRSDTATADGTPVCTQHSTLLRPGPADAAPLGQMPPPVPVPGLGAATAATHAISPALTSAYAEAARDYSPYCLDADAARAVGLAAPIVHGMLSLTLAAIDLTAAYGPLRRLGCRFSQPLFSQEGEVLTITHHRDAAGLIGFAASDGAGRPVITRGHAGVAA